MTILTQTLHLSRETKGTFRFDAPGEVPGHGEPHLTSIYVRKDAFVDGAGIQRAAPAAIVVTIDAA